MAIHTCAPIKYTNFRGLLPMNPRQGILTLFTSVSAVLFVFFSSTALAFPTYEGCKECHQGFRDNPHISLFDETNWGDDLMDPHVSFVGGNCDACHKSGPRGEVYLNFSIDDSLSTSCLGCHGREEDVTGNCTGLSSSLGGVDVGCGGGAGLRKYHDLKIGPNTCTSCHSNDPTPIAESVAPYNYGRTGVVMQDSCNSDGTESQFGTTGLDNDGDGQRDGNDSNCDNNLAPTQPGLLIATAVTTSSTTIIWGASTDPDDDAISYQVDYRHNGQEPWTDGGSTAVNNQMLSGLDSGQSYDVRVTPSDGRLDGPDRTRQNLFKTISLNSAPTQPGALSSSEVTTNSATVSWGASTDPDDDAISYQVEYRHTGQVAWIDGGNTAATSQPLSGLTSDQAYDVRVTPNDGTEDGLERTTLDLFQTDVDADLIYRDGFESN
jgi:hypothetical protein